MWILIAVIAILIVGFIIYNKSCGKVREGFVHTPASAVSQQFPSAHVAPVVEQPRVADFSFSNATHAPLIEDHVDQPLTGDAQTHTYASTDDVMNVDRYNERTDLSLYQLSRKNQGRSLAASRLPMGDLFGSGVAEPAYYTKSGRPLQSMNNNVADATTGIVDKILNIHNISGKNVTFASA